MNEQKDERAFTPKFLALCSDIDLALLQHELRRFPEDRPYLDQVLKELNQRAKRATADARGLF